MYIKKQYVFNKTPVFGWVLVNDSDRKKSIIYYILNISTFYLLSLTDADRLKAYFNNIKDIIICKNSIIILVMQK